MTIPTLYLFVGYPGSGKTSVARIIQEATGAPHLWADHIRQEKYGTPNLTANQTKELYDKLNLQTAKLLASGQSVIFDTNFNFRRDRDLLRQIATQNHAKVVLVWMTTPGPIARKRAVDNVQTSDTRIWGTMTSADFDRFCQNLEPPTDNEQPIKINGSQINSDEIKELLHI